MRVLVIGSGLAGLFAAVRAADAGHEVILATKGSLTESNTVHAQGGIAAALFPDDSADAHFLDTMAAGDGLCDPEAVRILVDEGPARVRDLIRFGVEFDRDSSGLARGLEAAHRRPRVVHAGGDATGAAIEHALVDTIRRRAVEIHEHAALVDLIVEDSRVAGAELLADARLRVAADAVILASGGAGRLFLHTTNPAVATADGVAAAWRAGAELADLEFMQFHPTALAIPGTPLVSEAVRGEGAVLRNDRGERFMLDVHPLAELAPRDVVARAIAVEMAAQGGRPVLLDATGIGRDALARRFPTITAATRAAGYDWSTQPVPVSPAAHYWMGGVATDTDGRTSIPGLYAVGEVACTGVHGANRLASNSLLEAAVFAERAVRSLPRPQAQRSSAPHSSAPRSSGHSPMPGCGSTGRHAGRGAQIDGESAADSASGTTAPAGTGPVSGPASGTTARAGTGSTISPVRLRVEQVMWEGVGVLRSGGGLRAAQDALGRLATAPASAALTRAELEDANLLDVARLVVDAALAREESRGAHFRSDFPTTDPLLAERARTGQTPLREDALAC